MQSEPVKIAGESLLGRRQFVSGLLAAGGAALSGCEQPSLLERPPDAPFSGRSLELSLAEGQAREADRLIRDQARLWAARTRGRASFARNDLDAGVAIIPARALGKIAGAIQPVPAEIRSSIHPRFFWNNLLNVLSGRLLQWGAVPVALPVVGEGQFLAYRPAALQQLGRPVPNTWDELADLGATSRLPPLTDDEQLEREFFTLAASYDRFLMLEAARASQALTPAEQEQAFGFQFDATGQVCRLDRGGFVKAASVLRRMQKSRLASGIAPIDVWKNVTAGVFTVADLSDFAALPEARAPPVRVRANSWGRRGLRPSRSPGQIDGERAESSALRRLGRDPRSRPSRWQGTGPRLGFSRGGRGTGSAATNRLFAALRSGTDATFPSRRHATADLVRLASLQHPNRRPHR